MTTRQPAPNPQTLRDALRELPEAAPPDDVWEAIERRTGARSHRRKSAWSVAAAAAALLAVSTAVWIVAHAPTAPPGANLTSLMAQSQQLERRVARHGAPEDAAWSASRRALVYRIADLDRELAPLSIDPARDPVRAEQLWRQRVGLMQSLAELDRAGAPPRTLAL